MPCMLQTHTHARAYTHCPWCNSFSESVLHFLRNPSLHSWSVGAPNEKTGGEEEERRRRGGGGRNGQEDWRRRLRGEKGGGGGGKGGREGEKRREYPPPLLLLSSSSPPLLPPSAGPWSLALQYLHLHSSPATGD